MEETDFCHHHSSYSTRINNKDDDREQQQLQFCFASNWRERGAQSPQRQDTTATSTSSTTDTNPSPSPLTSLFESNSDVANNSNNTSHGCQTSFQSPLLSTTTTTTTTNIITNDTSIAVTTAAAATDLSFNARGMKVATKTQSLSTRKEIVFLSDGSVSTSGSGTGSVTGPVTGLELVTGREQGMS